MTTRRSARCFPLPPGTPVTPSHWRIAARSYARSLGIELQSLPKPVDLAALRIFLANLGKTAMGLPVMQIWGGVIVDGVAERHRS